MAWQQVTGTSGTILAVGEAVRSEGRPKFSDLTNSKSGNGKKLAANQKPAGSRKAIDRGAQRMRGVEDRVYRLLSKKYRDSIEGSQRSASPNGRPSMGSTNGAQIVIAGGIILEETMRILGIFASVV